MDFIYDYLEKLGYNISTSYYTQIQKWIDIWKGKAEWLDVKTVDNKEYPMYSLKMAKRSCEDLASTITSEPFEIKAKKDNKILQEDLKTAKVLKKLYEGTEKMACSGTVATVARIINAKIIGEGENAILVKTPKTKIKTIDLQGNQIIPLTIEDGEIINCAFVSESKKKVAGKLKDVIYLEIHELEEKGYQITNKYFDKKTEEELVFDTVLETYNTMSEVPLFSINKLPRVNTIDNNNNLGVAVFANAIDQLKVLDVTYNNFGMDFKLGQKIMVINKKLTRIETEDYTDEKGNPQQRTKVIYPTDIQKQQFMQVTDGLMAKGTEQPYIYEYNPDLRVGDNKEGVQFALNTFSFEIGYGVNYYNFENGKVYVNTASIHSSNKDFVDNMIKIRRTTAEYLTGICRAILLCEKMLGNKQIDENQEIEIPDADGFLIDDETRREKLKEDYLMGAISLQKYLMDAYNMTEKDAKKEILTRKEEDKITTEFPEPTKEEEESEE